MEVGRLKREGTLAQVRAAAARVVEDRGYELVDVELRGGGRAKHVCLFVDKEGGIGIDELRAVSEEVSAILDAEDPVDGPYTLEVSSPGLDRPLKTEADYRRFAGRLARVSSYEPLDGRRHWVGRLSGLADGVLTLVLETEGGHETLIPCDKIAHARLEVEFPKKADAR